MSDSSTALSALSREYLTIAHNLANANTAGYKRRIGVFAEISPTPGTGAAPAAGVQEQEFLDLSQGRLVQTGRTLDVALQGPGFLVVETDHGERYTRSGVFRTDAQGRLVDAQQRAVAGEGGPITVPPTVSANAVEIAEDGRISAGGAQIGKLRIVEFDRPGDLRP
ncbi:MAG: flagellar hook basal-body protein, partial [Planctomycetes bacterium]|nr:flagellar hook basal-body protein [Planctomycetota bacterium]